MQSFGSDPIHTIHQGTHWFESAHRFSHTAMATTFEIFILHEDSLYAEQAAYAAFDDLDRLEGELSRFREHSDVNRINTHTTKKPLRIGLETYECLALCQQISEETGGAFDITVGSLMTCWLNPDKTRRNPSPEEIEQARTYTGMHLLELDEESHSVRLKCAPVSVDLGAFGKGYAVDKMADILREWDIDVALLHGGWSSVLALDALPEAMGWPVTISDPRSGEVLRAIELQNRSLSGSGLRKGRHIIDPRAGAPVSDARTAWAEAPSAALADALSTAFMVMTVDEIERYCAKNPDVKGYLYIDDGDLLPFYKIREFG